MHVKDLKKSGDKFVARASTAGNDYVEGATEMAEKWEKNAADAQQNYDQGVTAAVAAKSFSKGVKEAGAQSFAKGVETKGPTRYPQGVSTAGPDWEAGFSPYKDVLERTTLPPRKRKGDPANYARVSAVGTALHNAKESNKK